MERGITCPRCDEFLGDLDGLDTCPVCGKNLIGDGSDD